MSYEDYLRTATSNNGDGVFFVGDGPSSPKSKRQGSLIGYTGHLPKRADVKDGDDAIASPMEKYMIRGYTGTLELICPCLSGAIILHIS